MAEKSADGSIFTEMAERRSRSEALHAKAVEQGLAVELSSLGEPVEDTEDNVSEMKPAFDMESIERSAVSKNEIQKPEEILSDSEPVLEIPADPVVQEKENEIRNLDTDPYPMEAPALAKIDTAEEPVAQVESASEEFMADASSLAVEPESSETTKPDATDPAEASSTLSEVGEDASAEAIESLPAEGEQTEPETTAIEEPGERAASPQDLLEQSPDLLGDAPEPIADAEVVMAAEDLVDQIGSVVDIQSLPKTQPSRVMAKVLKPDEPKGVKADTQAEASTGDFEAPGGHEKVVKADPTASAKPKKKKKKVSLLDSYFKGL